MSFLEWRSSFEDIFQDYPDQWKLVAVYRDSSTQIKKLGNKHAFERNGFARFHCPKCGNGWTSAKAKVVLYYPNRGQALGLVRLRFFGQQCKNCVRGRIQFADPEFDLERIDSFLETLHERIGCDFYGKPRQKREVKSSVKSHNMNGPHESALCEACLLGCCDQSEINNK